MHWASSKKLQPGFKAWIFLFYIMLLLTGCTEKYYIINQATIPNNHTDVVANYTTNSSSFQTVPGSTIKIYLDKPSTIHVVAAFEAQTAGTGADATGAFAIQINGDLSDELQRYLIGTNDRGIGAAVHASNYTGENNISLAVRKVSGTKNVEVGTVQISAWAFS